ncbi:MAG: bifunctional phosphopantothenoylcysteine decarboxylase/phosphopantothenate--cysteine ligase CoaBC [Eubacterium sp.]|jgi:phosphopantothenoylcysteine decarboxylase/phosphopantothenate--cysteine ligase|nr:bifunctional phosphopantothenoylcysteine decarboxylase/phosphopantothenate--cysteine ligase CoaBC [Eubacterium sp.]MCH4047343.1 bifunctional phosphopantothenoylcysteine decarboxylase/phosphopantothenate--cysteine ligase CoaBC [Eubacterium sp.]MCH4080439.1 bifunctional phosphopantothenoylcysteine decarboxylase/phosphopantothenate--cysteine ligase CoaBC [Eubacterium sp.]MCH4110687.1 bifunctional phosphopantothenoylcysteine decarboxylase/phosphopantothenate--cysteine ligase CoaBC [Eubacterium sp
MFEDKKVLIGVSGGIAAYKTASLVSRLHKAGVEVHVIMTENATEFISPLVFETLSGQRCVVDTFDKNRQFEVEHVSLAKLADLFMIAPATANVIAKAANGLADDMLTTTFLASNCPKMVVPAMNTQMYLNPVTQDNLKKLKKYGIQIIEPAEGLLACGDTGKGKMPEPEELYRYMERELAYPHDLDGKHILVTAGATQESMDPVRYITNHSTGRMGFALAKECMLRGADVTLVRASATAEAPDFCKIIDVKSAEDMFNAVTGCADRMDAIMMAAAVADYTPASVSDQKIKKHDDDLSIPLKRTQDILQYLGEHKKQGQFLLGFSMETQNLVENSTKKLKKKNADMIAANNLRDAGAGFGTATNLVTLITEDGAEELPLMSKQEVAHEIVNRMVERSK